MSQASPCVLVVADPARVPEIAMALAEPVGGATVEVLASSGGDDTIDLFEARKPEIVVVTATLAEGDSRALIEALREMVNPGELGIVLVGDEQGPIRTALDALEHAPDRFVTRPLVGKALRFAVESCLAPVQLARSSSRTRTDRGLGLAAITPAAPAPPANGSDAPYAAREAMRARWSALADAIDDDDLGDRDIEHEVDADMIVGREIDTSTPAAPPVVIQPRKRTEPELEPWSPGDVAPTREPTLIIRDPIDTGDLGPSFSPPPLAVVPTAEPEGRPPVPLAELVSDAHPTPPPLDDDTSPRSAIDSDLGGGAPLLRLEDLIPGDDDPPPQLPPEPHDERPAGRDFARELRAKMSMMAQRLFQADSGTPPAVSVAPRHDHKTEIDLAALGEEPLFAASVTELEARRPADTREHTTSPGSWDTQVRERGLPDEGEVVRGVSDAALLLAKLFAQTTTGRVGFHKDDVEKVVFFDQGRPVFASSNERGDRMGQLLVREGKITASQYERCQSHATTSGRRMGEILVDFGYLKRRELLPAVRRHVEDIIFSLFGWDSGHYHIHAEQTASGERIRLSRHPASLILEGIRRKLDRTTLEKLVGAPSTVVEVPDREKLGGIVAIGDLALEERAALAAFDGQADLAQVARTATIDVADVLPLAWGLCVLGLATARRVEADTGEEQAALVGETDLAIDRERVRARWQLVSDADYFALLGVRRDATGFEIRRAYQAARRDFAADCFPADLRRELARELDDIASVLDEAFRVLRDDRLRVTYLSNLIE